MVQVPADVTAAQRARWLAELSAALDEAQSLIWRLGMAEARTIDVLDLSARVEAAHADVRELRLGRREKSSIESHPDRSDPAPWELRAERA